MKFIKDFREGERVQDVYLVKHKISATTKNGKAYETVVLQDRTGTIDGKIWEPNGVGIEDYDALDYVDVFGEVTIFQGTPQLNIKRLRVSREGEYDPANYLPVSKRNNDEMYKELQDYIASVKNRYLNSLLNAFFTEDQEFIKKFRKSSAAKSMHHGFVGGLMEHTLSVAKMCEYLAGQYPRLNRDLLITAALCHDIAKVNELSLFPENDYTDDGQLLGHIVMGVEMIGDKIRGIEGFPPVLASELKHCIVAHHGELEYGSPKKPALMEAVALNMADNTDAKMEMLTELFDNTNDTGWLGYNRMFESNLRMTAAGNPVK